VRAGDIAILRTEWTDRHWGDDAFCVKVRIST
jgi:hypothetical protein